MIGLLNCIEKPAHCNEKPDGVLLRRGDASQCPVCGSQVSPEAYHCPKCHSYFCFHCRARFADPETQLRFNPALTAAAKNDVKYHVTAANRRTIASHRCKEPVKEIL
jgi:hypothetical protein